MEKLQADLAELRVAIDKKKKKQHKCDGKITFYNII